MTSVTTAKIEREIPVELDFPIKKIALDFAGKDYIQITGKAGDKFCGVGEKLVKIDSKLSTGVYFPNSELIKFAEALLEFAKQ